MSRELQLIFESTKLFEGYSACFRQWRAEGTHCKFLHGYGVSFKIWFRGELDEKNWVFDFGGMRRAKNKIDGKSPKEWFDWLLDHTVIVAEDDPLISTFRELDMAGMIQLRTLPDVGAERFAEYLLRKVNEFLELETGGRVVADQLEFFEHGRNSAVVKIDRVGMR